MKGLAILMLVLVGALWQGSCGNTSADSPPLVAEALMKSKGDGKPILIGMFAVW